MPYISKDQVKANLINYILTNKGERLFDPTFGGDLRSLLFDPTTLLNKALRPTDVLVLPVVLLYKLFNPIAVLFAPITLDNRLLTPTATLFTPVVLFAND